MPPQKRLTYIDPLSPEPVHERDPTVEGVNRSVDEMCFQQVDMQETPLDGGRLHANEMEVTLSEPHSSSVGKISKF